LSRLQEAGEAGGEGGSDSEGGGLSVRGVLAFIAKIGHTISNLIQNHLTAILLLVATVVVFRSPLTKLIARLISPRALLSGQFPRFTLTEILIMLNTESHTGVLHVKGESCRGKIYFENGEPCHCTVGKMAGVNALHHLARWTHP
jgi:hypothetical protein